MAKIQVVSENDPAVYIEIADPDGEDNWDGNCTGCAFTVSSYSMRSQGLADAINEAEIHLDNHH